MQEMDGAGRRHIIISLVVPEVFSFGYVYIHEDTLSDGQAKARAHHHWKFIKENSQTFKIPMAVHMVGVTPMNLPIQKSGGVSEGVQI